MSEIYCKSPWPKIRFKTESGIEYDGYLYYVLGDCFYISQNQSTETIGLAQNWIIPFKNVIKFYDEKFGLTCNCGTVSSVHLLTCKRKQINTDLL